LVENQRLGLVVACIEVPGRSEEGVRKAFYYLLITTLERLKNAVLGEILKEDSRESIKGVKSIETKGWSKSIQSRLVQATE